MVYLLCLKINQREIIQQDFLFDRLKSEMQSMFFSGVALADLGGGGCGRSLSQELDTDATPRVTLLIFFQRAPLAPVRL